MPWLANVLSVRLPYEASATKGKGDTNQLAMPGLSRRASTAVVSLRSSSTVAVTGMAVKGPGGFVRRAWIQGVEYCAALVYNLAED